MITVKLERDTITPDLQRILRSISPGGALGAVLSRAASEELRRHFRTLNGKRANRLGGRRSNFYSRVAESVQQGRPVAGGLEVRISHPHIAQRVFGGRIVPRKRKAVAIPVHPSGYGVFPRIFPAPLAFIPGRGRAVGYLVEGVQFTVTRGPRKGNTRTRPKPGGALIYVLVKSVFQRRDNTVLPSAAQMGQALTRAARLVRI